MRIVLLKDCPIGSRGQIVAVSDKQGRILVQTGVARAENWRDQILKKDAAAAR